MKAIRGVLLTCDVAVKQILLAKNQEQNFVIEDLDEHHLLIIADEEARIRRMLETEVSFSSRKPTPRPPLMKSFSWRKTHTAWKAGTIRVERTRGTAVSFLPEPAFTAAAEASAFVGLVVATLRPILARSTMSGIISFHFKQLQNTPSPSTFTPRTGSLILPRNNNANITLSTPALLVSAPRGVVPHLSRDHLHATHAVKWINVPLETFLERHPPLPALSLAGLDEEEYLLSVSLRDPGDLRHVPNNGDNHVTVLSARGAKKVAPAAYKSYLIESKPDIAFAQTDICIGNAPHSQKRLTKTIERSAAWLLNLLILPDRPKNVFVHLAGGESVAARRAFAQRLKEPLDERERVSVVDLTRLDDGVTGYSMDLAPLRQSLTSMTDGKDADVSSEMIDLLRASLESLPLGKPRLVTGAASPQEVLKLVWELGIDAFDAPWAFEAAQWGVALDFTFPVTASRDLTRESIGHNLYDSKYQTDFNPLADEFLDGLYDEQSPDLGIPTCPCLACSPTFSTKPIEHSPLLAKLAESRGIDLNALGPQTTHAKPVTRAFLHHLLHTHEMSAHALLVMHNLAVAEAFFEGIRLILEDIHINAFEFQVFLFQKAYGPSSLAVLEAGKQWWMKIDRERGKGRLAREANLPENQQEVMSDPVIEI